jgi:hypothetical protein
MPESAAPAPGGDHAEREPARYRILYERQGLGQVLRREKAGGDQAGTELLQRHCVGRGLLATTVYQPGGHLGVDVTQAGRRERRGKLEADLGSAPAARNAAAMAGITRVNAAACEGGLTIMPETGSRAAPNTRSSSTSTPPGRSAVCSRVTTSPRLGRCSSTARACTRSNASCSTGSPVMSSRSTSTGDTEDRRGTGCRGRWRPRDQCSRPLQPATVRCFPHRRQSPGSASPPLRRQWPDAGQ